MPIYKKKKLLDVVSQIINYNIGNSTMTAG